jgi:phage gp36-like protein
MAQLLKAPNYDSDNIAERTEVNADVASGQATVTVKNVQGFANSDFFRIGEGETAEIKKISSISNQTITATTNFTFPHNRGEKLVKLRFDQIKFKRANNVNGSVPVDGSFSTIATVNIEADQDETEYNDPVGSSSYWYKYTYYNSDSANESDISDSIAVRGGGFGYYCSIDDVRIEAGFVNNFAITDKMIQDRLDEAQDEVKGALSARYTLPLSYVPKILRNITKLLAAGYLLITAYGPGEEGTNKEGQQKIQHAQALLAKIVSGEIALIGIDEQVIAGNIDTISGYPDNTAEELDPPEGRLFRINKVF